MVWRATDPEGCESRKIVWEVAPYLRGRGLDLGAGVFKILPHVISIDNGDHAHNFGHQIHADVTLPDAADLSVFASQSMDFVFSSHLLEHIDDYKGALKEWWRVIKMQGKLILYLPHKSFYPNMGKPGANPTHKHDFMPDDIIKAMENLSGWDLIKCQDRNEGMEYSMLLIFRKIHGRVHEFSHETPKHPKRACVCRFGAYGDLMQASSVIAGLKQQGYHVTLMASQPGVSVVAEDPNIDEFMLLDRDQVPNADLAEFWAYQAKQFDKFVNLSESVEGTWLALPGRTAHGWAPLVRHTYLNQNYLEFQHKMANVPHVPQVKFYTTAEERAWSQKTRAKMGKYVIVWSMSGSSVHKVWAGMDAIIAALMLNYKEVDVVLVGGPEGVILEQGWEKEPRVHKTCGKWSIRQTLSFIEHADLVIGPETGVLNAASCLEVPKLVFLSHSTVENLTRDWVNTTSLQSRGTICKGRDSVEVTSCHQLHYGWTHCTKDEESGTAQCMVDITVDEVWYHVEFFVNLVLKKEAA